jgi:hypothetical protein
MVTNDISIRPSEQQITIKGTDVTNYNTYLPNRKDQLVRRTQAHVLRAPPTPTVIWPGEYLEIPIPLEIDPDSTLAVEPRPDCAKSVTNWPRPHILEAVAGRVRILNDTSVVKNISRHEHFCQVRFDPDSRHQGEHTPLPSEYCATYHS